MKKLSIFIAILFSFAKANAQYDCLQDTIYYYHYEPGTSTKIYDSRIITNFSTSGKPTQQLSQNWNTSSSSWINTDKAEMQYNTSNLLIQQINFIWNTSSSSWTNKTKYQISYTSAGFKNEEITESWNTSTNNWVGYNRYVYLYNSNYKEVSQQYYYWDASTWVNIQNRVRTYSGNNLMNESINYRASASSPWETTNYTQWLYNSKGKVTEALFQNNTSGTLTNFQKRTYAYNITDTLVTEEISQKWNNATSVWDNSIRLLYSYNSNNLKSSYTTQNWDLVSSSWLNATYFAYFYNSSNKIVEELGQIWDNSLSVWINNSRMTTYYNASQNPTEEIIYYWDATTSRMAASYRNTYLYNTAQKKTERRSQRWNNTLGNWGELNLEIWEYNSYGHQTLRESFTAWDNILGYYIYSNCERNSCRLMPNSISDIETNSFHIYPNPLISNLLTISNTEPQEILILDLQGKVVYNTMLESGKHQINLSSLPSGLYIVKAGNKIQKLIKE